MPLFLLLVATEVHPCALTARGGLGSQVLRQRSWIRSGMRNGTLAAAAAIEGPPIRLDFHGGGARIEPSPDDAAAPTGCLLAVADGLQDAREIAASFAGKEPGRIEIYPLAPESLSAAGFRLIPVAD